jgi:hypothetical protein
MANRVGLSDEERRQRLEALQSTQAQLFLWNQEMYWSFAVTFVHEQASRQEERRLIKAEFQSNVEHRCVLYRVASMCCFDARQICWK